MTEIERHIASLRNPYAEVRYAAAWALSHIGTEAASAVPALIESLRDSDTGVRYAAAWALGRIAPAASAIMEAVP